MEIDVQRGFFWHVHHGILVEFCHSYKERASHIYTDKLTDEQELRFHLFKPVKGSLPQAVVEAGLVYDKAWQARDKARQAYDKTRQVYDEARQVCDKARQVFDRARQVYDKALNNNMLAITALHEKECPNCPWDGITIFTGT